MSDPSERQGNGTAHQDPTHVPSTVGNGIAGCCVPVDGDSRPTIHCRAQVPLSGGEPPSLGGEVPAPVFRALPHFRSWLSFEGSHKLGCYPAAIKPARLG